MKIGFKSLERGMRITSGHCHGGTVSRAARPPPALCSGPGHTPLRASIGVQVLGIWKYQSSCNEGCLNKWAIFQLSFFF